MVTSVTPYCAIDGHDFSSIVYTSGAEPSGGSAGVEEIQVSGRNYGDIRSKGRAAKKYKIRTIKTKDRELIENFLDVVNTAEEDAEFYPFDVQRFGLIASAYAYLSSGMALDKNLYEAVAEITCREAWLNGPDKGIAAAAAFPVVSAALTNEGQEQAPISLLQVSGGWALVEDLSVRITPGTSSAEHDRELVLCEKMLYMDLFEVGWRRKEAIHSYDADLTVPLANISANIHDKMSGGSVAGGILTLDNGDYYFIPFYGPLPMSGSNGAAFLDLQVTALTGDGATCQVALLTDLSDMVEVEHDDLVVGLNRIYVPDLEGAGHVAIGLKAAAAGSVSLSGIYGQVKRYIAPSQIPWSDPDEVFKIRVEASAGVLTSLVVDHNDRYWY